MKTGFICASGYNLVASATRNGHRLIAIILGAWSGAARTQQAAELLERGFNSAQLSWLTPSLGTVDELAPIDARRRTCTTKCAAAIGASRRRRTMKRNPTRRRPPAYGHAGNGQAFMLSSLKPPTKFVLGPPIDTEPPVVVFTGRPIIPMRRQSRLPRRRSASPGTGEGRGRGDAICRKRQAGPREAGESEPRTPRPPRPRRPRRPRRRPPRRRNDGAGSTSAHPGARRRIRSRSPCSPASSAPARPPCSTAC